MTDIKDSRGTMAAISDVQVRSMTVFIHLRSINTQDMAQSHRHSINLKCVMGWLHIFLSTYLCG